jgi:hypothetical protein
VLGQNADSCNDPIYSVSYTFNSDEPWTLVHFPTATELLEIPATGSGPVRLKVDIERPKWEIVVTTDTTSAMMFPEEDVYQVEIPSTTTIKFQCQANSETKMFEKKLKFVVPEQNPTENHGGECFPCVLSQFQHRNMKYYLFIFVLS